MNLKALLIASSQQMLCKDAKPGHDLRISSEKGGKVIYAAQAEGWSARRITDWADTLSSAKQ